MRKILDALRNIINTKRWRDSCVLAFEIIGGLATLLTILGISINTVWALDEKNWIGGILLRICILMLLFVGTSAMIYKSKGKKYSKEIPIEVGQNKVLIKYGNIFNQTAWRVIGVDTRFDTRVDNKIISDATLHGQLVLKHGTKEGIQEAVSQEAQRRGLNSDETGGYTFPLGTAIPYKGSDGDYIMVALTELDSDFVARTRMPDYETTLMKIWREIERVYGGHDLAIPILGDGVTHFDDGQDNSENLLRCMLCTLNTSRVHLKSNVSIIVYDGNKTDNEDKGRKNLPLYEFKDFLKISR